MSDERLRDLERAAQAGDPEAATRLKHERCRCDSCCAHALTMALAPLDPKGQTALIDQFRIDVARVPASLDDVHSATVTFRLIAPGSEALAAAVTWLRHAFQPRNEEPMPLGRILYGAGWTPEHPVTTLRQVADHAPTHPARIGQTQLSCTQRTGVMCVGPDCATCEGRGTVMVDIYRCPRCNGSGGDVVECFACDGSGHITLSGRTVPEECPLCHRHMCDHTPAQRGIIRFIPVEFTDLWEHR